MFYLENTTYSQRENYERMMGIIGSLSNLFSESEKPYLPSRVTENLFCKLLFAENLSRGDVTADAKKNNIGIGIKTWIGTESQKIAEFNKDRHSYADLPVESKIKKIAQLRNDRIAFTMAAQGLTSMVYHCSIRDSGKISLYECPLVPIDIDNISHIVTNSSGGINFTDGINKYKFYDSKSTLYKTFDDLVRVATIDVEIVEDPYTLLYDLFTFKKSSLEEEMRGFSNFSFSDDETILKEYCLPLYSTRGGQKYVPAKNNLNIRFANGRARNIYELGIPVPAPFAKQYPEFFTLNGSFVPFDLHLPDGSVLSAKRCQENGKSLMSNPNSALGEWLIDKVLKIDPEEPITYAMLEKYGIDSVYVTAVVNNVGEFYYKINFGTIGSYERFMNKYYDALDVDED